MEKGCNGVVRIIAVKVIWRALRFLARGPCVDLAAWPDVVFHPSPRIEIGTYDLTANHFVIKDYDIFERGRIRGLISYCEYNGYYRVPTDYVTDNEYVTSPMIWRSEVVDLKLSQQTIVIVSNYLFIYQLVQMICRSTCLEAQEIQQLLSMSHCYASWHIQEMAYQLKYAKINLESEYVPKTLQMWGWDRDWW